MQPRGKGVMGKREEAKKEGIFPGSDI